MKDLVSASGIKGGVVVHIGCGEGEATAELYSGDEWLVYGLDTNAAAVAEARRHLASKEIYGAVSAEVYDGENLPFGDNIVNHVVVSSVGCRVSREELLRVLVPGGVLVTADGKQTSKSRPDDIDEWTHYLYDASNNALSKGKRGLRPNRVQWFAGPEHSRDHDALASMSAMTSSDGRVFYIYDEGPVSVIHQPADWKLIARDAFNGKLLWKRGISDWMTHLYNFRGGPVQLTRRLVSVGNEVFVTLGFEAPVQKLDAATGKTLMTYQDSAETEELIVHDGVLLVVTGDPELLIEKSDGCVGFWELAENEEATVPKQIIAYDAATGKEKWKLNADGLKGLVPLSLCAQGKKVFYLDSAAAADGKLFLSLKNGKLICLGG